MQSLRNINIASERPMRPMLRTISLINLPGTCPCAFLSRL